MVRPLPQERDSDQPSRLQAIPRVAGFSDPGLWIVPLTVGQAGSSLWAETNSINRSPMLLILICQTDNCNGPNLFSRVKNGGGYLQKKRLKTVPRGEIIWSRVIWLMSQLFSLFTDSVACFFPPIWAPRPCVPILPEGEPISDMINCIFSINFPSIVAFQISCHVSNVLCCFQEQFCWSLDGSQWKRFRYLP